MKILTIYVEPPYHRVGGLRTVTGTRFEAIWAPNRTTSNWFFLTDRKRKVYLKVGWNLIGRRRSNNISIKEETMRSSELTIYIAPEDEESPSVHSVNNNCFMDGIRMSKKPETLYHRSAIGIFVEHTSKLIILEFFKETDDQRMDSDE